MSVIPGKATGRTDASKTPMTRLLDLLAGWSEYSQTEKDTVLDKQVSIEELCDLYQQAGRLMTQDQTQDEEAGAVRSFVERRMLPLILRR